jgi:hypothetical protein
MFAIVNKSPRAVLCRFNSGCESTIAPGARLEVSAAEVRDNRWLEKLQQRSLIDVLAVAGGAPAVARKVAPRGAPHRPAGTR